MTSAGDSTQHPPAVPSCWVLPSDAVYRAEEGAGGSDRVICVLSSGAYRTPTLMFPGDGELQAACWATCPAIKVCRSPAPCTSVGKGPYPGPGGERRTQLAQGSGSCCPPWTCRPEAAASTPAGSGGEGPAVAPRYLGQLPAPAPPRGGASTVHPCPAPRPGHVSLTF